MFTSRGARMDTIDQAIQALRRGGMIVVVDNEDRENEGDLVMDARFADAASVNFMALHGRGLICMPMEAGRLAELGLGQMVAANSDPQGTAFAVSTDHCSCTTGISASDRAATIRALLDPASRPEDFRRPGHVFPLAARAGGGGSPAKSASRPRAASPPTPSMPCRPGSRSRPWTPSSWSSI